MNGMTGKLLNKEIKLCWNVNLTIWLIFGSIYSCIPNYPKYCGPFYIVIGILSIFTFGIGNHDLLYTTTLPVKRNDAVKARFIFIGFVQLLDILICFAVSLIAYFIFKKDNVSGINTNIAWLGLQLVCFAAFDIIFLTFVYKKPEKPTLLFFIAFAVYFGVFAICEIPVWNYLGMVNGIVKGGYDLTWALPDALSKRPWYSLESIGHYLYMVDLKGQLMQIPVLIAGLILWVLSFLTAFKGACKRFNNLSI